ISISSWPGLTRPSTSFLQASPKTWMPGAQTSLRSLRKLDCGPGMTISNVEPSRQIQILHQGPSHRLQALHRAFVRRVLGGVVERLVFEIDHDEARNARKLERGVIVLDRIGRRLLLEGAGRDLPADLPELPRFRRRG